MTTDNNKGLFEKIKKTMTAGQSAAPVAGRDDFAATSQPTVAQTIQTQIEQHLNSQQDVFSKQVENYAELARLDLRQKEQALEQKFAIEQRRLTAELEAKYQKSSEEYIRKHEEELQQKFEAEKQNLQKTLKEKYERIAQTALQQREQEILDQARQEIAKAKAHESELISCTKKQQDLSAAEWQLKLDQLKQELEQNKQRFKFELENAINKARLEQETITQEKYEALLQRERTAMLQDFAQKQTSGIEQQSTVIKKHYEIEVQRKLEQVYADYQLELNRQLLIKEQQLLEKFQQDLAKNNALQQTKFQREIAQAVANAVKETEQKLQDEFEQQQQDFDEEIQRLKADFAGHIQELEQNYKEQLQDKDSQLLAKQHEAVIKNQALQCKEQEILAKEQQVSQVLLSKEQEHNQVLLRKEQQHAQELNTLHAEHTKQIAALEMQIEKMQADFTNSRMQLQQQIESALRAEYESQISYYKSEEYQAKELNRLMAEQRVIISAELEAEQTVVLKHKQRELEAEYAAKLEFATQKMQTKFESEVNDTISQKEQQLEQEYAEKLSLKEQQLQAECETKLQDARITVEYATKQQALAAEQIAKLEHNEKNLRSELSQQHSNETRSLLQKQQQILLEQFNQDLQKKLQDQELRLNSAHQSQIRALEAKLQVVESSQQYVKDDVQQSIAAAVSAREHELTLSFNAEISRVKAQLEAEFAEKRAAILAQNTLVSSDVAQMHKLLNEQENALRLEFSTAQQKALAERENMLRVEFSAAQQKALTEQEMHLRREFLMAQERALIEKEESLRREFSHTHQQALLEQEIAIRNQLSERVNVITPATVNNLQLELTKIQQELLEKFANEKASLEAQHLQDKQHALDELRQQLIAAAETNMQDAINTALARREHEIRLEFQNLLRQQRDEDVKAIRKQIRLEIQQEVQQEMEHVLEEYKQKLLAEIKHKHTVELEAAQDNLKEDYARKLQNHIESIKAEQQQELKKAQIEFDTKLQDAISEHKETLQSQYEQLITQIEARKQEAIALRIEQERKKLALKFAQDKTHLIQELSAKFNQEKQAEMVAFENHLRDSLYKEMVKQKEYLQTKFNNSHELALQEQKRRLEAEHRHELERVKQGYFVKKDSNDFSHTIANTRSRANQRNIESGVENLADRILAKFQGRDRE